MAEESALLSGDQVEELLNAIPLDTLTGERDAALIGLLVGCGLQRSEVVSLRLDQLPCKREHWVFVDLLGTGGRIRTVPVPI